jgi:hypothetical protein
MKAACSVFVKPEEKMSNLNIWTEDVVICQSYTAGKVCRKRWLAYVTYDIVRLSDVTNILKSVKTLSMTQSSWSAAYAHR